MAARIIELVERDIEVFEEEILEYAGFLGIDLEFERDLLDFAKAALTAKLPSNWQACHMENDTRIFYFNRETGQSIWDHPLDKPHQEKVKDLREQRRFMMVTMDIEAGEELHLVCTSLGGNILVDVEVEAEGLWGDVEDKLRERIVPTDGAILRFILPDAAQVGYSWRSKRVADIFGVSAAAP